MNSSPVLLTAFTTRAWVGDSSPECLDRLITVERPALLRAMAIARRDDYPDASDEWAILNVELMIMDARIAALQELVSV